VISLFESTINEKVALAIFFPVDAGHGGVEGTQTATMVVRSIALGDVSRGVGTRLLTRGLSLRLINGAIPGVTVAPLIGYVCNGKPILAVVLVLAIQGDMLGAAVARAGIPLLLRRIGQYPAVYSAVFVITCTGILGFLSFLGLAAVFISLWL